MNHPTNSFCEITGCGFPTHARGLCRAHYDARRKRRRPTPKPLAGEQWRRVAGFEGLYEVSSFGRVKSLGRRATRVNGTEYVVYPRIMTPSRSHKYLVVTLTKPGQGGRVHAIHRLVCEAFHGLTGDVVRHLNHDSFDNRASNLAPGTQAQNIADSMRDGRLRDRGTGHPAAKLTPEDVAAVYRDPRKAAVVARDYGVSEATIYRARQGARGAEGGAGQSCRPEPGTRSRRATPPGSY